LIEITTRRRGKGLFGWAPVKVPMDSVQLKQALKQHPFCKWINKLLTWFQLNSFHFESPHLISPAFLPSPPLSGKSYAPFKEPAAKKAASPPERKP